MKGKMFKYICSVLLLFVVLSGNSQTINGRLYTQFNNYYKWRGGAFDSVLLLPNLTGTAGLRGGALRYNGSDSSLYVYTGTQWRKIDGSGGSTPTLQQVTTQGNTTTNDIFLTGISLFKSAAGPGNSIGNIVVKSTYNGDSIKINNRHLYWNITGSNFTTGISTNAPSQNNNILYPDSSGTLPLRVKLNNTTYAPASNGTVDLGTINSDTATVVKAYVTNAESVTITKGQVVYIFGASGDRASVKLAKNTSDTFSSKTLGIVREDIAAGQAGWITTQGQVSGINLGAYTPGDILWLDSIPGGFTTTKPQAPYHAVFLGVVERANVGNGLIYVKPQNGVELDELHDVRITSLANNEIIRYNSALGYWENKSIVTTLGYTPLNVTDTTAMLSPYLRKVDTLSLSNRIDAMQKGVQWQGVDSSFAYLQSSTGNHELENFNTVYTTSQTSSAIPMFGTKYSFNANSGNYIGFWDNGVNGIRLGTLTSTTATPLVFYGHSSFVANFAQLSSDYLILTARVRVPDLSDGTNTYHLRIGFVVTTASPLTGGCVFTYDLAGTQTGSSASANWQTLTASANNRTYNQNYTGVSVSANTWTTLQIIASSSNVFFLVNGSLVATHTTNLPTSGFLLPYFDLRKTAGSTARTFEVDYITTDIKYSTPR